MDTYNCISQARHVPQECQPDPGEGGSRPLVHHLHRAPGGCDQGVRAPVPRPGNTRLLLVNTHNTRLLLVNTHNTRVLLVNIHNTRLLLVNTLNTCPRPDQLLDPVLRALPVDHHPAPGDSQCLLHSHPVNCLQGKKDHVFVQNHFIISSAITSSECHGCLVEPSEVDKIMSICCIQPINCVFNRVTAGYFYLKRGKTGPMPAELFDYKYVLIILIN